MAKKSLLATGISPNEQRLKQLKSLERQYQEWKNDFTIDFCYNAFLLAISERGYAQVTIYNYKYFYKKLLTPFLEKYFKTTPKDVTVEILETEPTVLLFQNYIRETRKLGDNTLFSYMKNLKAFGRWCVQMGYMEDFHCTVKKVETAILAGDKAAAETALRGAISQISRAASKGVYHKNTASRKIARLTKSVNKMA